MVEKREETFVESDADSAQVIEQDGYSIIKNQVCPVCHEKKLTLTESEQEIPFFGLVYIFSMSCENCKYHKADVESEEQKEPCRYSIEVDSEEDMKIRVVKSAEATVRIPHVGNIEPGPASNGYVTNIEGIIQRMKRMIEAVRDNQEEDEETRKKAKNLVKKLIKVQMGQEKLRIIIEDPTGNSAIISDKAEKSRLK